MSKKKESLEKEKRDLDFKIEETGKLWSACQKSKEDLARELEETERKVKELKGILIQTQEEEAVLRQKYENLLFDRQDVEREISKL